MVRFCTPSGDRRMGYLVPACMPVVREEALMARDDWRSDSISDWESVYTRPSART
jgi:hypothetical protein